MASVIIVARAARREHASRQYHRARLRLIIMSACLNNADPYGKPALTRNYHYFFETAWDESEALWIDAQQQAIGWASR